MAQVNISELTFYLKNLLEEKNIPVDKIILFGSWARNSETEESDIDIIIVSKSFRKKNIIEKSKMTSGIHWSLVDKFRKAFDILYYSDIEWKNSNSIIISEAKEYGRELFAA